ncbi:hypothetical protein C8R46DRAFT_1194895 [Mycena filopes]|nr:hypothetical protein C8R46DRAFT_1194895 [Mycena filopes]
MSPDTGVRDDKTGPIDSGGVVNGGEQVGFEEKATAAAPPASISAAAQQAALLRFKPSPRDVISGIAPHVFEDQRSGSYYYRQQQHRRRRRRSSPEFIRRRSVSPSPRHSPLRVSAVVDHDAAAAFIRPKESLDIVVLKPLPLSSVGPTPNASPKNKPKRSTTYLTIHRVLKGLASRLK